MILLLCLLCLLPSCTLPLEPDVPLVPSPVVEYVVLPASPIERVEVTLLPSHPVASAPVKKVAQPRKALAPATGAQVVAQAQDAARVEPSDRGYHGGSAEHTYGWQPGKVYTIYLSPKQGTGIFLPPGERLVSGLYLSKDEFEVKTERAGLDLAAYDAITIRPLMDTGSVSTFLLTESGRRYLLHLVVGKTGMLAVTFEMPQIDRPPVTPVLPLPKPQGITPIHGS